MNYIVIIIYIENSLNTKNDDILRMVKYDTSYIDFVFDQNLSG